jgi:hypothetical protein
VVPDSVTPELDSGGGHVPLMPHPPPPALRCLPLPMRPPRMPPLDIPLPTCPCGFPDDGDEDRCKDPPLDVRRPLRSQMFMCLADYDVVRST